MSKMLFRLFVCVICISLSYSQTSLTKFDHFVKPPVANIHTGGRLTERHIEYIAQAGYASILSVVTFQTNDTSYNGVNGQFPSSEYEAQLAVSNGLVAKYMTTSLTPNSLSMVVDAIDSLKKPIYLHCHVGYTATLFTELYLYTKDIVKSSNDIYANGLNYGYDYQANSDVVSFINTVTNSNDAVRPESIEQTLANGEASYKSYYWVHRTGHSDYWYNVGQILDTHVDAVSAAGYKTVISFRDNGEPTNRLKSDSATGAINNNEFSDVNGNYDVSAERAAVEKANMAFVHLPLNSSATTTWTVEQYALYAPLLAEAQSRGPVLSHCASGYRSATYVIAYIASQNHQCTAWALAESALIGLVFDTDKQVVDFFQQILKC